MPLRVGGGGERSGLITAGMGKAGVLKKAPSPTPRSATAAAWLDAALSVAEVEAMAKWLKAASNSSMLGRSVGRARLLSFSRRRPYERSTSQQGTLDDLKGFRNLKRKTLTAKGKAAGGGKEVAG